MRRLPSQSNSADGGRLRAVVAAVSNRLVNFKTLSKNSIVIPPLIRYNANKMATQARDTSPDAERVQFQIWREMPAWRKLELVAQMNETVRELAMLGLRQRYPNASRDELKRRYLTLILGEELSTRVYGELPKETTT